jgi:hypothetical protein
VCDGVSPYSFYDATTGTATNVSNTNLPTPKPNPAMSPLDTQGGPFTPLVGTMYNNQAYVGGGNTHPYSIYTSVPNSPTDFFSDYIKEIGVDADQKPIYQATQVTNRHDFDSPVTGIIANQL